MGSSYLKWKHCIIVHNEEEDTGATCLAIKQMSLSISLKYWSHDLITA